MTTRRLAAILAADVVGFSSMMEKDEEGTASRIRSVRRDVIEPTLSAHQGRLVKATGDGFLAEFASPVEAVRCALAIHDKIAGEPANDGVKLRIGINLGDIIIEDDGDVFGDGVNVAARLEQMADPGGVLISGKIHEEIAGKVGRTFESRGEQQVKNIARPVHVYALAGRPEGRSEMKALTLPDKPSVAVLPFTNMSGDPEQEYSADGLVEDIITALSRVKSLFVIARNSSFTYKGRAVDVRQVGSELGVRYVLEGSIRKAGRRLRITGQLIEATTGAHIWANRYEGGIDDVFELQDQITSGVVAGIEPSLLSAELHRVHSKPTENLNAYDLYLQSLPHIHEFTESALIKAEELLRRALSLDTRYSDAWAALADCTARQTFNGFIEDWDQGGSSACNAALRAVEADSENGRAVSVAAWNLACFGQKHDDAVELADRALKLHPNSAYVQTNCGWAFTYNGEFGKAIVCFDAARRMNPLDPRGFLTFNGISMIHLLAENFEEVERWTRRALDQRRAFPSSLRIRAAALAHLGRMTEARDLIAELLSVQPKATVERAGRVGIRDRTQRAIYLDGLRLAGLPE